MRAQLSRIGLNVACVVDGSESDALLAGCRSILVFASGGPALWDAFLSDLQAHPQHLRASAHPLDDFVQRQIAAADPAPCATRRWIRCAALSEAFIDFRPLGVRGGVGWHSRLGLVLHPVYGPWLAFRAACLTREALPLDAPLADPAPCQRCSAPCIAACPGAALRRGSMDIHRCSTFHFESARCDHDCDSRLACPEGAAFRYGVLERHYHYSRRSGRHELARALGISDDPLQGRDPNWAAWVMPREKPA